MIKMDNIHGGSWKKLQNWATGLFLKKTADSDLNMNGNDITNAGNLYTQAQVNSTFMKKTADSNLNMNGYSVDGIRMLRMQSDTYSECRVTQLPRMTTAQLGLASATSIKDCFVVALQKIAEIYPTQNYTTFFGNFSLEGVTGYATIYIHQMASVAGANNLPINSKIDFYPYGRGSLSYYVDTSGNLVDVTSGVNSMGDGYIRYENGLQICWGYVNANTPALTEWGNGFASDWDCSSLMNFQTSFSSAPSISVICSSEIYHSYSIYNAVATNTGITKIRLGRPIATPAGYVHVKYFAIGRWK